MPQTAGSPVPTTASPTNTPATIAREPKRRTSDIKQRQQIRSGWLTRWFSEKFRLETLTVADVPSPPAKSLSDNTSDKPRAASCLKLPDQVRRRPTVPNTRVQFTMPPKIVVVNREDLCFSRADDLSSSEEPVRFDLAEFANSDDNDDSPSEIDSPITGPANKSIAD